MMATFEGAGYARLMVRGIGWAECHYDKGSSKDGTHLGGEGGEPTAVDVAAARR
jgi:hypothetical protein